MARDITIRYVGDSSSAERAADRVHAANEKIKGGFAGMATSASDSFRSVGRSLSNAGRSITTFATLPIAAGFAGALQAASDLNEQVSKMETVFGDQSAVISKFADDAAKKIGLSKVAALEATGTFGNMFSQMGIGASDTAKWSTSLTTAASDLASFHNADITQVIEAQSAAFRGEYDALQRFIPTINAAAVEQKALEQTGKASADQLTAGEKAAATYTLMMEGMGAAQGDFARTSESAANKQRSLTAQFTDLAGKIGNQILPIAIRVGEFLADWLDKFSNLSPKVQTFILIGAGLLAVLGPLVGLVGALATVIGLIISPVGLVILALAALVAGVIYAYKHFEGFRDVVDTVISWFQDSVVPVFQEVAGAIADQFGNLVDWVREHWAAIEEAIGHVLEFIRVNVEYTLGIIKAAWELFGDDILTFVQGAWSAIQQIIDGAMQFISGLIKFVLAIINGEWGAAWDAIVQMLRGIWTAIVGLVEQALNLLRFVIGAAWEAITSLAALQWGIIRDTISAVWEGIKTAVSAAAGWVRDTLAGIWDAISNKFWAVWNGIRDGLGNVWEGIKSAVVTGVNSVIGIINGLIGGVNKIIDILPGNLPTIPTIGTISAGGGGAAPGGYVGGARPTGFASGGVMPFITNGPRAIVGEGNRRWPEYVIPTDPQYRGKAQALTADLLPKLMASGGMIPAFALGGIPNPIEAVGGVIRDAADFVRKGAAMAILGPINAAASAAIDQVPWNVARQMGHKVRQTIYDFIKGEDDKLPSGAGGAAPRGSGIAGLVEPLASKVATVIARAGGAVSVVSGWRSSAQQQVLYNRYLAGTGNLAAPPGSSKHERGLAVDFGGNQALYQSLFKAVGGHFPVRGEPWHGEVPGYRNGIGYVPNDGLAYLHKGEAVTSAANNRPYTGPEVIILQVDGRELSKVVREHERWNPV